MTKTLKDVIELAGGSRYNHYGGWRYVFQDETYEEIEILVLKKEFWQALGKELGGYSEVVVGENFVTPEMAHDVGEPQMAGMHHSYETEIQEDWQQKMHGMIDHIIAGGELEDYLIELINE